LIKGKEAEYIAALAMGFLPGKGSKTNSVKWSAGNFASGKLDKHFQKHVVKKQEWADLGYSLTKEGYLNKAKKLLNTMLEAIYSDSHPKMAMFFDIIQKRTSLLQQNLTELSKLYLDQTIG